MPSTKTVQYIMYVYIIQSEKSPSKYYTGLTNNIKARIQKHNTKEVISTKNYIPWRIIWFSWFDNNEKAVSFEKYLKSGSGVAFKQKRLI